MLGRSKDIQFHSIVDAKLHWSSQKCHCQETYEVRICSSQGNYGCLMRQCPRPDKKCFGAFKIVYRTCINQGDKKPRCFCGDIPSLNETRSGANAGRTYYECNDCDFFLWESPNQKSTSATRLPRKASDVEIQPTHSVHTPAPKRARVHEIAKAPYVYVKEEPLQTIDVSNAFFRLRTTSIDGGPNEKEATDLVDQLQLELLDIFDPQERVQCASKFIRRMQENHKWPDAVFDLLSMDYSDLLLKLKEVSATGHIHRFEIHTLPMPSFCIPTVTILQDVAAIIPKTHDCLNMDCSGDLCIFTLKLQSPLHALEICSDCADLTMQPPAEPIVMGSRVTVHDLAQIFGDARVSMAYHEDTTLVFFHDSIGFAKFLKHCSIND